MRQETEPDHLDEQIKAIAALTDPTRRALYRYVVAQREPVSREQAAAAVGVARHTAKFHLDKLASDGLLDTEYSRPAGRGGPGAGRPAKRYRRSSREVAINLPERRYDLAGQIMARAIAITVATGTPMADALRESATLAGRGLGEQALHRLAGDADATTATQEISKVLAEYGYEPYSDNGVITLANCPFHALANENPELVCGMNLNVMRGLLETCQGSRLEARPEPEKGQCCITFRSTKSTERAGSVTQAVVSRGCARCS